MLMTEEPRRRLSVRSNNLVLPYIDVTPTIRSVPVGSSHGSVFQAKEGAARPTAFQRPDRRRCGLPAKAVWVLAVVVSYALAVASEDAHWSVTNVAEGLAANDVQAKPDVANSSGHSESYDGVNVKPSSIQPVTPPIIIFTGKPSRARRNAALLAPLQCGPAQ